MNKYLNDLVSRYSQSGVLVDTNILLLLFVGSVDPDRIVNFSPTNDRGFTSDDYELLASLLAHFQKVVTTPHILTGTNSFLGKIPKNLHPRYFERFAEGIEILEEYYIPSVDLVKTESFPKLGLTDAGIVELVKGKHLVLTEDFHLAGYLAKQNVDALNFNQLRPLMWSS